MSAKRVAWRVLRAAKEVAELTDGKVESCSTRWDAEKGGRVLTLTVFWPGTTGYDYMEAPQHTEGAD